MITKKVKASVLLFSFLFSSLTYSQTIQNKTDKVQENQIHEEQYIPINGIEQWVTIKGNPSKPIILFLHGGPGSPITPYIDVLYKGLEKDFIVVQWDQRGSGRTYGHNNPPEELSPDYLKAHPLTLKQMTNDGVALSKYLLKHLRKQKIILSGTSWGSALGVKIATQSPHLFYAYIGHSQIVNPNFTKERYSKLYKIAEDRKDDDALKILNTIGQPPYSSAKNSGMLYRVIKKYEKANSTPAPENWFILDPAYNNEKDNKDREDGDDYSFVNFVGDEKLGVQSMGASIDMMKDNLDFKIPFYLIQGEEDILTPKDMSKKYFEALKAPKKEYFLLPKAAHGFNQSVVDTQYKIFRSIRTK
ncbi:alpha/beta hydrolase family protein [Chryseobacterium paridis]|uniref:Proline iminopeptidase n=1 Tax=Chryseobacterium paridis TaxID=2800328 RepID=A0ABS1FXN6_9FLAO|nr:alpha/beta hydrolase [Chryseobacterium paridis]MBK1897203.1 alpha/beta hydrolase [Chryseobacterium paridis]